MKKSNLDELKRENLCLRDRVKELCHLENELKAAKKLIQIYHQVACESANEGYVRKRRDQIINERTKNESNATEISN